MEEIIEPISKELLKAELTEEKRLRMQQAEVQENRWISMNTISWKIPTNS